MFRREPRPPNQVYRPRHIQWRHSRRWQWFWQVQRNRLRCKSEIGLCVSYHRIVYNTTNIDLVLYSRTVTGVIEGNAGNNQKQLATKYALTRTFRFDRTEHTYCSQLHIWRRTNYANLLILGLNQYKTTKENHSRCLRPGSLSSLYCKQVYNHTMRVLELRLSFSLLLLGAFQVSVAHLEPEGQSGARDLVWQSS